MQSSLQAEPAVASAAVDRPEPPASVSEPQPNAEPFNTGVFSDEDVCPAENLMQSKSLR